MAGTGGNELIVVGGGFAGLVAAVNAQVRGIGTLLCEASGILGGAARYSRGTVWAMDEEHLASNTRGCTELQALVVEETAQGREWLERHGVRLIASVEVGYGSGRRFDVDQAVEVLVRRFLTAGGRVRLSTRIVAADQESGGVVARTAAGEELRATRMLLATGGFASSRELCGEFGVPWDGLATRSHAFAIGDGLRIARAAGGGITERDMHTFYGHAMAEVTPAPEPEEWFAVSQIYGHLVTAISFAGDEIRPAGREGFMSDDELNAEIGLRHGGRAVYLVERSDLSKEVRPGSLTIADVLSGLDGRHSSAVCADDGAVLAEVLRGFGVRLKSATDLLNTLRYPVHAIPVRAGRTLTGGGVLVDERMRVIDSASRTPVWSGALRCAGADIGGINSGIYVGGLSTALVTALRATTELVAG